MANTITYVSLQRLAYYDGKIKAFLKAADEATLKAAQDYADSLADNYDAAGVAAGLVQALENGQVKANKEAIEALQAAVGNLEDLQTTDKDSLVDAINEVRNSVSAGGTAAAITLTTDTTTDGMLKSYTLKQGDNTVGVIDIPKELMAVSGSVVVDPEGQTAGTYIMLTIQNGDPVYINVASLIDNYTAKAGATQVQLTVDAATREISAVLVAGGVGTTELADNAVVTAKIADGNVTKAKLSTTVQASLDKADAAAPQTALDAEIERAKAAEAQALTDAKAHADSLDEAMDLRVKATEEAKHTHGNKTVIDGITAEKVTAWDAAEGNAIKHADDLNTAMNTRVEALEAVDHDHANKALLDTYTQTEANLADAVAKKHEHANAEELAKIEDGDVAKWDEAATKAHEHTNKTVLDGITSGKVSAWDSAEQNAKNFVTQEIAKIDTGVMAVASGSANGTIAVDGEDVAVKGLGSAAYTAATAYDKAGDAAQALTDAKAFTTEEIGKIDLSGIGTNASAITALQGEDTAIKGRLDALEAVTHTEISEADIDAMFAEQA